MSFPEDELVSFAATWDPMPMHLDRAFAAAHGGLTAPGTYLLAVKLRLIHTLPLPRTVIASFGYDEVRFHQPVHAGEALTLEMTCMEELTFSKVFVSKSPHGNASGIQIVH
jgi:acyl dehydratase